MDKGYSYTSTIHKNTEPNDSVGKNYKKRMQRKAERQFMTVFPPRNDPGAEQKALKAQGNDSKILLKL